MKDKLSIWWKFCLLTLLLVLAPPEIMAQGLTIKGQVLDSNNEPLIPQHYYKIFFLST